MPGPNILFVLFHDFTSNSAYHVHSYANCLTDLGCHCAVAVPNGKQTIGAIGTAPQYAHYDFAEVLRGELRFPDGRSADIVHCWTPREAVREFYERAPLLHAARLFIHLEDNEWEVASRTLNHRPEALRAMRLDVLDAMIPPTLSHPIRAGHFLERAAGVTLIVQTLADFIPADMPTIELWPSADEALFRPRPIDWERRRSLGIAPETTVIVYAGNVHASNTSEVRSLYLAVAMLNREGHPTTLVRTGRDHCEFLGADAQWARQHVIDLGFVDRAELPAILSMANLFVQPGKPGAFNDYRFPSKIPEFCAIGRPLILPASNVGLSMRHREDAYVVPRATATAIVEAVVDIRSDAELESKLAAGAQRFFKEVLCWRRSARKLLAFYDLFTRERDH